MKYRFLLLIATTLSSISAQILDSMVIKQVDSLLIIVRNLTEKNEINKAGQVIDTAEKLTLLKLGKFSVQFGKICHNKGRIYYRQRNYNECIKWYEEALLVWDSIQGKENLEYASSLSNLALVCKEKAQYMKAEKHFLESLRIRKQIQGNEHQDYASALYSLAIFYQETKKTEKAESIYVECKIIREKILGKEHFMYARVLSSLSTLYRETGRFDLAEQYQLEALAIREKVLGKQHNEYAQSLHNLAVLYKGMAKFEKAAELFNEAIAISRKLLGEEHPDVGASLNSLANTYWEMGDFESAEKHYLEANGIIKKALGIKHPRYADNLVYLADYYKNLGNYERALACNIEIVSIRENDLGNQNSNYAIALNNLANTYAEIKSFDLAKANFEKALEIVEKTLGKENPDYAMIIDNLGQLNRTQGRFAIAQSQIENGLAIRKNKFGMEHPHYAVSLNNLAALYADQDFFSKAEPFFLEAKYIHEKALGKEHPDYLKSLSNLASLYKATGAYDKTEESFHEFVELEVKQVERSMHYLSERELTGYLKNFEKNKDKLYSFAYEQNLNKTIQNCLNHSILYKGFILNAAKQLKKLAYSDSASQFQFEELKRFKRQLSNLYSTPKANRNFNEISDLENKTNDLEKSLTRSNSQYGTASRQVKWNDVRAVLKPDQILIEFVKFSLWRSTLTDSIMYAAIVLKSENAIPVFVPLFEERELTTFLDEHKNQLVSANEIYSSRGNQGAILSNQKSGIVLYNLIWKPLDKYIKKSKTILFSSIGSLHKINLSAIPISEAEILADRFNLIEINSTRQLVFPTQIKNVNNNAVLFGGIQFEQDTTIQNNEPLLASRSRGELSFNSIDSTLRGGSWNYLAGTEVEVNSIEKIMQSAGLAVTLKNGYLATEESFKNIGLNNAASPRILHVATHGYFFPDSERALSANSGMAYDSTTSERTAKAASLNQTKRIAADKEEPVFKISEHPMLRSGLIMAGGNAAWQGKKTLEGREDGILTAYEISQMNLSNTELVVLSACETGLGDIQGNEGVYGLQRAFKIAGAKYLIMSLWQVPDKQTSLLMTTFYKKWLETEGPDKGGKKMSIPDAFHAAQKELRDIGLDPYQWAGFVLVE